LGQEQNVVELIKSFIPVLLKRLFVTVKIISQSADECVRAVLTNAQPWAFKLTPDVRSALTFIQCV